MLKAVIFDCDGVIADSEHMHFSLFRDILKKDFGLELSKEEYMDKYLAMDDRNCFRTALKDRGQDVSEPALQALIDRKTALYKEMAGQNLVILPGVVEFVMAVSQKYPLGMASGALKEEVLLMLDTAGIRHYFDVVVGAEDVNNGKPAPDAYLKALSLLNEKTGKNFSPAECLVVEDSKHGIASAHAAGMKCVAVCSSYGPEELAHADHVVPVLTAARTSVLEGLFK